MKKVWPSKKDVRPWESQGFVTWESPGYVDVDALRAGPLQYLRDGLQPLLQRPHPNCLPWHPLGHHQPRLRLFHPRAPLRREWHHSRCSKRKTKRRRSVQSGKPPANGAGALASESRHPISRDRMFGIRPHCYPASLSALVSDWADADTWCLEELGARAPPEDLEDLHRQKEIRSHRHHLLRILPPDSPPTGPGAPAHWSRWATLGMST